jgi:hypothetical protein
MKENIYFIYATEKLAIIPLYHPIPPMHTTLYLRLSCCDIQLISVIESFYTGPFSTVIYGGMVHRKSTLTDCPGDFHG